jgi:RNA polymerase sigma factor (sigma-70 family)
VEIVRHAQAGDREAFEMLAERHAAEMYRLAAAIVGEADARDVAQEVLLAAWQQLPRLRDPDAFTPWVRRICVNRSRNWLRAGRRRPRPAALDDGESTSQPDARRDFRSAVEARLVLAAAFDALSVDQRTVLALHYAIGFSIAETADALHIRVGTAKSRLSAGLATLRLAIGPPDADVEPTVAS